MRRTRGCDDSDGARKGHRADRSADADAVRMWMWMLLRVRVRVRVRTYWLGAGKAG